MRKAPSKSLVRTLWAAGLLLLAPWAPAQVIVYEMSFEKERGFNSEAFDGGYLVVPGSGGAGSFIFTDESARTYQTSSGAAEYFAARTSKRESRWVVKASITAGGTGTLVAFGDANRDTLLKVPNVELIIRIATDLKGRLVAATDAVDADNAAVVGSTQISDWRLKFRRQLTDEVNHDDLDVDETIAFLTDRLDRRGFNSEGELPGTGISITTTSLPNGTVGSAYSETLASSGGTGTLTWSLSGGSSLPDGLSLSTSGVISGTPTSDGTPSFTVAVSDSGTGTSDTQSLTLTIDP